MLTPEEVEALYPIKSVLVFQNGLTVHREANFTYKHEYSPRKGIYEMSKKSKMKLVHIINNCPIKFKSLLTLTWGDFLPPVNGVELKRQLNIYLNRFRKHFKSPEYLWFLEFQRSGRPHIHIMTTVEPSSLDILWHAKNWPRISVYDAWTRLTEQRMKDYSVIVPMDVGVLLEEYEKSQRFNQHPKVWEKFRKKDGAFRYALKYATKSVQKLVPAEYGNVGRFWGTSENVTPIPIGAILLGQEMSEAEVRSMIAETKAGMLPLIPHYIFQKDAVEFFSQHGLTMTEILGENLDNFVNNMDKK